jgi:hypothetical protein
MIRRTDHRQTDAPGEMKTPRRPGQPGYAPDTRPQAGHTEPEMPRVGRSRSSPPEKETPPSHHPNYQSANPAEIWRENRPLEKDRDASSTKSKRSQTRKAL